MTKKNNDKLVHIRVTSNSYRKLENEAKKNQRSIPNMAKYLLEKKLSDSEFTNLELLRMQSLGGTYSDLDDEDDIYSEKDAKPIQWD